MILFPPCCFRNQTKEESDESFGSSVLLDSQEEDPRSYMYPMEDETRRPNIIRPITCDGDIPRAGDAGGHFVGELFQAAFRDTDTRIFNEPEYDEFSSSTDDPFDEIAAPMRATGHAIPKNMTEDEFYFTRDWRPGHYRPPPSPWVIMDPDTYRPGPDLHTPDSLIRCVSFSSRKSEMRGPRSTDSKFCSRDVLMGCCHARNQSTHPVWTRGCRGACRG